MAIKLHSSKPIRAARQSAPENVSPPGVVDRKPLPPSDTGEESRPQGRHRASSWSELLLWLRTVINLTDLAVRLGGSHHAGTATASPVVEKITELAAWMLHTITGLVS
ncbi:hypothetical protein ACWDXV_18145 [Nocardia nova]